MPNTLLHTNHVVEKKSAMQEQGDCISILRMCYLWCFFLHSPACSPKIKQSISSEKEFDVVEATIDDIHQALQKGTCNCEQLVTAYLRRIEAYDQSTKLNSIVVPTRMPLPSQDKWIKNGGEQKR